MYYELAIFDEYNKLRTEEETDLAEKATSISSPVQYAAQLLEATQYS